MGSFLRIEFIVGRKEAVAKVRCNMPFPEVERVIYRLNPLKSVICQLRFPPILIIDAEIPAKFQERVRDDFPLFEQAGDSTTLSLPDDIARLVPTELKESLTIHGNKRYQFISSDKSRSISLTKDFLALEVKQYERWEDFRSHLVLAVTSLIEVYRPAHFTRVGLRYQNVISRANLGLEGTSWHELLDRFIIGPLAEKTMLSRVVENHGAFTLRLTDEGEFVRIQYGLGTENTDFTAQEGFLLDNDFYTDTVIPAEVNNVASRIDRYNTLNRRLFWLCISERLHQAMGPESACGYAGNT